MSQSLSPWRQRDIIGGVELAQLEDEVGDLQVVHLQRVLLGRQRAGAADQLLHQLEHLRGGYGDLLGIVMYRER